MLEKIPSQATMIELLGQSLFYVWQLMKNMIWKSYETRVVKIGLANTSTAEAVKRFAACTQEGIALVL